MYYIYMYINFYKIILDRRGRERERKRKIEGESERAACIYVFRIG